MKVPIGKEDLPQLQDHLGATASCAPLARTCGTNNARAIGPA
jgi:hypothetical protein